MMIQLLTLIHFQDIRFLNSHQHCARCVAQDLCVFVCVLHVKFYFKVDMYTLMDNFLMTDQA